MARRREEVVRIEGLRALEANFAELTKATGRNALRRGLAQGGSILAARMEQLAPRETARDQHQFADTIAASIRKPHNYTDPGKEAYAAAIRSGANRQAAAAASRDARRANPKAFAEVFVGPGRDPAAIQQEFGNVNHGQQPFARPAWDAGKGEVLSAVVSGIREQLARAVARARRRAESRGGRRSG